MPQYLGVSNAVLDCVIFCHQEDSLWPLSEAGKLKGKFDEIFEAEKYTKAVVDIKKLQKGKREELGKFKKDEEYTKVVKGKAEQNTQRNVKLSNELTRLSEEYEAIGIKIEEAAKKSEEFAEKANSAGQIVYRLDGKRIEERTKEESVESLRENLHEMTDSDEALQHMLEQYEERVAAYDNDLANQKEQYANLAEEMKGARSRLVNKERECGTYEAQKQAYERQVQNRESLVKETARSHNIRGFDLEVDDAQVQAFMDRINKMAREQNASLERARRETQEELQRAQKVLNDIDQQKTSLTQRKELARQAITKNDRKIADLQTAFNKVNIDEGAKATLESNLRDTEAKLETAKAAVGSAKWDSSIENAETELHQLDDRKEKLEAELVEGTKQAGDSARLDFVQKELKTSQGGLETMKGAHGDKISSVVGQAWTPATVESDFQRAVTQSGSHVTEAERQRDGTNREMEQIEFKLSAAKGELKTKRTAVHTAEKAIRDAVGCEAADFPDQLQQIAHGRDIAKSDAESFSRVLEYLDSCIKNAKDHNGCRTCARPFKNAQELEKMVKTVESQKKRLEGGDALKDDLKEAEEALKEATAVSTQYDTWKKVKAELPDLEKRAGELAEQHEKLVRQLEDQDAIVRDRQASKRDVEALSKTVQNIAKYSTDIANFENQIKELTAKQKAAGLSRGLEIIQDDIKKVNDLARTTKARLAKSTGDRERSTKLINSLELERRDVEQKLSTAEYQLKEKRSLEGQIEEYRGLNSEQRETVKTMDNDLQALVPQMSQAQAKYDDIAVRGEDKTRELQAAANKLNSSFSDLKKADEEVKSYVERGGPEQLARGKREISALEDEITRVEQEVSRTVRAVKDLENQLRNHSDTRRSISDNQRFRRDLRQLQSVRAEIAELESHNAEEDKRYHDNEAQKWQRVRNKLTGDQATISGSVRTMDDQLKQLRADWETDYKDAAKKYKEAHIMVETTKACVDDLGRYSAALDQAIMKYHSIKMEEINHIVAELWRSTYQGTDVDTIMIRSESENVTSTKSYNYRVVMVKQDTEMDMRGRCSAGQKVLASIIIRLALAECFGSGCGMIALDEPTTNLDEANIKALAKSLKEIVKKRRDQPNFQLIIITHDEEFLRAMGSSEIADVYWRVSRNERQKSTIERQSISEVSRDGL